MRTALGSRFLRTGLTFPLTRTPYQGYKLSQNSPTPEENRSENRPFRPVLNLSDGASDEIRTRDLFFTKEVLYP